jgi:hypothetical protein
VIPLAALIVDESLLTGADRNSLGIVLIGIVLFNFLVNYLIFNLQILKEIYIRVRRIWLKRIPKSVVIKANQEN